MSNKEGSFLWCVTYSEGVVFFGMCKDCYWIGLNVKVVQIN